MSDAKRRVYRSVQDRKVAGVCAGIGEYLGVDATLVRLAWALVTVLGMGIGGVVLYLLAWWIIPERPQGEAAP